jgi:hypothetical protein
LYVLVPRTSLLKPHKPPNDHGASVFSDRPSCPSMRGTHWILSTICLQNRGIHSCGNMRPVNRAPVTVPVPRTVPEKRGTRNEEHSNSNANVRLCFRAGFLDLFIKTRRSYYDGCLLHKCFSRSPKKTTRQPRHVNFSCSELLSCHARPRYVLPNGTALK